MEIFVVFGLVGLAGVVLLSIILRKISVFCHLSSPMLLVCSHSLIILLFLLLAPIFIVWIWGSPYGDIYLPYFLVPGGHIYHVTGLVFNQPFFLWLLGFMEPFPASVVCVIVGPGFLGLIIGNLQWYLIGFVWDRLVAKP